MEDESLEPPRPDPHPPPRSDSHPNRPKPAATPAATSPESHQNPGTQKPHLDPYPPLPHLENQAGKSPLQTPDFNVWKNPPTQAPPKPKKFHLRFIPPTSRGSNRIGICSSDAVAGELQILDNTLVGFFLGKKPSYSYVRSSLLKQWKLKGSVHILQLTHGGFAFRFSALEDRDSILEDGVFYIGGQPLFLRNWERSLHSGGILGLKRIPLWITLPGLPLHLWGEESLSVACSLLGKPLFTDKITAERSRWAFARACVEFSADSPMLESITLEDDVGNVFEQPVKYEWRPSHCISCGIFGHTQDSCPKKSNSVESDNGDKLPNLAHEEDSKMADNGLVNNGLEQDQGTAIEPDDETIIEVPPIKMAVPPTTGQPLASLLQMRNSKLCLLGWNSRRVRKKKDAGHDPTRSGGPQAQLTPSESGLALGRVSSAGVPPNGPLPSSVECIENDPERSLSNPLFLNLNSNFAPPAGRHPPLSNRFSILDADVDSSTPDTLDGPSILDYPLFQPFNVKPNRASFLDHPSCVDPGLDQTNRDKPLTTLICSDQTTPSPTPLSTKNPPRPSKPDNLLSTPKSSSAGRTPFHSHLASIPSQSSMSTQHCLPPLNRKHVRAITSVDLEKLMAPRAPDPWFEDEHNGDDLLARNSSRAPDQWEELGPEGPRNKTPDSMPMNGDDPDHMMEPIPYVNTADDTAEDIEENVDEEAIGSEEDVDEDSEEEKENQLERVDAVQETARRNKLSYSGRYDDNWVTTTDLNDPRRINCW